MRGIVRATAVKAPDFGDNRKAMIEDIAVLTAGTVFSEEVGLELEKGSLEQLGSAKKVTITKDATIIVGGGAEASVIADHVSLIEKQIDTITSQYDKDKLQQRIAKLCGGVAVIKIGAATEVEMKEKKDRVDDALHATRAAVEEGIVAGGGVALTKIAKELADLKGDNDDQNMGIRVAIRAMEEPLRQIAVNAGDEASVVANAVKAGDADYGYNAASSEYGNMIEMGILDPVKVTRFALQSASSVAGLMITTEAMISDLVEGKALDS